MSYTLKKVSLQLVTKLLTEQETTKILKRKKNEMLKQMTDIINKTFVPCTCLPAEKN
jgi:hypothetical protein